MTAVTHDKNIVTGGADVFAYQTLWWYSDGEPLNGGVECRWSMKKSRFWTNSWLSIDDCCSTNCEQQIGAYLEGGRTGARPPPLNSASIRHNADCLARKFEIWSVDSRENHYNCCHQMSDFKVIYLNNGLDQPELLPPHCNHACSSSSSVSVSIMLVSAAVGGCWK